LDLAIRSEPVIGPAEGLSRAWEEHLFSDQRATAGLSRSIKSWNYKAGGAVHGRLGTTIQPEILLSFDLQPPGLHARYGIARVDARTIISVHDALTRFRLWQEFGLQTAYGAPPAARIDAGRAACLQPNLLRDTLARLRAVSDQHPDIPLDLNPFVLAHYRVHRSIQQCRVAARIFDVPELAALIFPPPAPQSAAALLERCDQLAGVLEESRLEGPSAPAG
jgi:hypothetical protein